jgi:pimeloyl-ACP methyl ester carboxylesterase
MPLSRQILSSAFRWLALSPDDFSPSVYPAFMYPTFLPSSAELLTESTSIQMAQRIERFSVTVPFHPEPIASSFVYQAPQDDPDEIASKAIVLLHGFDSSLLEFRRLLPLLAQASPTYAVDLLGFGFGDRPSHVEFSPTTIRQHLYALWQQQLNQRPIILVGASMGGAAALDFTLTYPEAVHKLVLIDSAGFAQVSQATRLSPPFDQWATQFLRSPWVRRQVSLRAYQDASWVSPDAECCAALHLKMPRWSEALISFTNSGGYGYLGNRVSQIQQPTLVLWGRGDRILGTRAAPQFIKAMPTSRLVWLDRCGHVPHLEQPKIAAEQILRFVNA